jgi:uncharacterized protein
MRLADDVRTIADAPWVDELVDFVRDEMRLEGSHDEGHLSRVIGHARTILEEGDFESSPDREVVAAAALGHGLVDLPKDHPERHLAARKSADELVVHLRTIGAFDSGQIELVAEAVESHSFSSPREPESIEAKIVCDADRLDAIGAVGIARTFMVGGSLGRLLCHPDDPMAEAREVDDETYTVDHFFEKLLTLRDRMHTSVGRIIAERRHRHMEAFLDQLARETGADDSNDSNPV